MPCFPENGDHSACEEGIFLAGVTEAVALGVLEAFMRCCTGTPSHPQTQQILNTAEPFQVPHNQLNPLVPCTWLTPQTPLPNHSYFSLLAVSTKPCRIIKNRKHPQLKV